MTNYIDLHVKKKFDSFTCIEKSTLTDYFVILWPL